MEIVEVVSSRQLKDFLNLPKRLYIEPNTRYVHPLLLHMKMMMGKIGTPQKHFFLAYMDGKPVARLGCKVHRPHKKEMLHFGFFECDDRHPEAATALFQKAHDLYPHLDMMGPFHFRMEDPYVGVLVEGFDKDPFFLMPYNPPTYDSLLSKAGLTKVMDLFTYQIENAAEIKQPTIKANAEKAKEKGVSIRFLDRKNLESEARIIAGIFNDALSQNWGYEEFLEDQVKEMVTLFKLFIDPRIVAIARVNGKDVGCLIMLPNYNPIIKAGKGRVTPTLIWNYFTKRNSLPSVRGYALGVLREYHGYGIGSALTDALFDVGPKYGYNQGEISWILANNGPMNELSKAMGGQHNKVYRIYEKKGTGHQSP